MAGEHHEQPHNHLIRPPAAPVLAGTEKNKKEIFHEKHQFHALDISDLNFLRPPMTASKEALMETDDGFLEIMS